MVGKNLYKNVQERPCCSVVKQIITEERVKTGNEKVRNHLILRREGKEAERWHCFTKEYNLDLSVKKRIEYCRNELFNGKR